MPGLLLFRATLVGVPPPASNRVTLLTLSFALGTALLIIAFLLGRESARAPEPVEAEVSTAPVRVTDDREVVERRWPEWADLEPLDEGHAPKTQPAPARIEEQSDRSLLRSNRGTAPDRPLFSTAGAPSDSARSTTSAYFMQMDLIRSEAGAGDPNAFAMELIKAAMDGSTAGFDQLVADMQRMEQQVRRVTPPPPCENYHQRSLATLAEGREILEEMKDAIVRRDIESLTAIAKKAAALEAKAESLQQMRERISANGR